MVKGGSIQIKLKPHALKEAEKDATDSRSEIRDVFDSLSLNRNTDEQNILISWF